VKIRLLTITHKTPSWVNEGYLDYAKRLPAHCSLELVEISAEKRLANADIKRIREREGEKLLAAVKPQHSLIALDAQGKLLTTEGLSEQLADWQKAGRHIDLLIGGPDGLSTACLQKAKWRWSLSTLTFPHFLVRVIVAEQIYRAHSLLIQHPYHR
jgi:23S rRNA (pseudouridine1915-N3)-methyltransferase